MQKWSKMTSKGYTKLIMKQTWNLCFKNKSLILTPPPHPIILPLIRTLNWFYCIDIFKKPIWIPWHPENLETLWTKITRGPRSSKQPFKILWWLLPDKKKGPKNLNIFDNFGPLGLKWGPKLKSCWLIWFSMNMDNLLYNFEHSSLKHKIIKMLTLLAP